MKPRITEKDLRLALSILAEWKERSPKHLMCLSAFGYGCGICWHEGLSELYLLVPHEEATRDAGFLVQKHFPLGPSWDYDKIVKRLDGWGISIYEIDARPTKATKNSVNS